MIFEPYSHCREPLFNGNEFYCYHYYDRYANERHSLSTFLSSRLTAVLGGHKTTSRVANDLHIPLLQPN
jgi:hypothetical protein